MNLALTIRRVPDAGAVLECVRRGWSVALVPHQLTPRPRPQNATTLRVGMWGKWLQMATRRSATRQLRDVAATSRADIDLCNQPKRNDFALGQPVVKPNTLSWQVL